MSQNPNNTGNTRSLIEEEIKNVVKDPELAEDAISAVEKLGVTAFLSKNPGFEDQVYENLRDCDEYAESVKVNSDMMFIARALPIINGIIHIASNRQRLNAAMGWVTDKWKDAPDPDPDAISILSALTLIYMTVLGYIKKREQPKEVETWKRILHRVRKFSTDI